MVPETRDKKGKILVVFDTNKLRGDSENISDYSTFNPTDLLKLITFIQNYKLHEYIDVALPDIVLKEILNYRVSSYRKKIKSLNDSFNVIRNLPEHNLGLPSSDFNYEDYFWNKLSELIDNYSFVFTLYLDYTKSRDILESMTYKACKKFSPFKDNGTGFKDGLIGETILRYERINDYTSVFLYSGDKDFENYLKKEFEEKHGLELKIKRDFTSLEGDLRDMMNVSFYVPEDYPDIVELINTEYFEKNLINYIAENYDFSKDNLTLIPEITFIEDINEETVEMFDWMRKEDLSNGAFNDFILVHLKLYSISPEKYYNLGILLDKKVGELSDVLFFGEVNDKEVSR